MYTASILELLRPEKDTLVQAPLPGMCTLAPRLSLQFLFNHHVESLIISWRTDNLYQVHDPDAIFLQKQPAPN